jgi:acetyl-CoA carboxylase carboxyltransferase component
MAHLSILVDGTAQLFVAGPPVVKSGSGEDVDKEQLGGSRVHARNGAVDLVAASELDAFRMIRRFLSYLPQSAYERPPVTASEDPAGRQDPSRRWAWPSADWGSLPVEGGIEAAYRADLERADDPAAMLADIRARLDAVRNPLRTAERFGIEEIIDPRETRPLLCDWVRDAYATLPVAPGKPSFGTRP